MIAREEATDPSSSLCVSAALSTSLSAEAASMQRFKSRKQLVLHRSIKKNSGAIHAAAWKILNLVCAWFVMYEDCDISADLVLMEQVEEFYIQVRIFLVLLCELFILAAPSG